MRNRRLVVSGVLMVVLASCATEDEPYSEQNWIEGNSWARVTGRVTDAMTGRPIVGARLGDLHLGAEFGLQPDHAWAVRAVSDLDGRFDVPVMWYQQRHNLWGLNTVTATADGYVTKHEILDRSIAAGSRQWHVDFELTRSLRVRAEVTDAAGRPVAGATVHLVADGRPLLLEAPRTDGGGIAEFTVKELWPDDSITILAMSEEGTTRSFGGCGADGWVRDRSDRVRVPIVLRPETAGRAERIPRPGGAWFGEAWFMNADVETSMSVVAVRTEPPFYLAEHAVTPETDAFDLLVPAAGAELAVCVREVDPSGYERDSNLRVSQVPWRATHGHDGITWKPTRLTGGWRTVFSSEGWVQAWQLGIEVEGALSARTVLRLVPRDGGFSRRSGWQGEFTERPPDGRYLAQAFGADVCSGIHEVEIPSKERTTLRLVRTAKIRARFLAPPGATTCYTYRAIDQGDPVEPVLATGDNGTFEISAPLATLCDRAVVAWDTGEFIYPMDGRLFEGAELAPVGYGSLEFHFEGPSRTSRRFGVRLPWTGTWVDRVFSPVAPDGGTYHSASSDARGRLRLENVPDGTWAFEVYELPGPRLPWLESVEAKLVTTVRARVREGRPTTLVVPVSSSR